MRKPLDKGDLGQEAYLLQPGIFGRKRKLLSWKKRVVSCYHLLWALSPP